MLDITKISAEFEELIISSGAKFASAGASSKSDAVYFNAELPLEIDIEENMPLSFQYAQVRISNHFNNTTTANSIEADVCFNLYDCADIADVKNDLAAWIDSAKKKITYA